MRSDAHYAPAVRSVGPAGVHSVLIASLNVLLGAVAAQRGDFGELCAEFARAESGSAPVWGTAAGLAPERAALVNAAAAHYFTFDDTADVLLGHPSVVLVPALVAAAPPDLTTEGFVRAYAAGYESMVRLALRINPGHYRAGFHATATLGTVGAAHAIAHARGDDDVLRAAAVGIAATTSAGLRVNIEQPLRPWHAGFAAVRGIQAADLARLGLRPHPCSIEATHGLADTLGGSAAAPPVADPPAGEPARAAEPIGAPAIDGAEPLNLKTYPGCGALAPAITALLGCLAELAATAADVTAVAVKVDPFVLEVVTDRWPATIPEASFSLRYALTVALAHGTLAPRHLSTAVLGSSALRGLAERIMVVPEAFGATKYESVVTVTLADGQVATMRIPGVGGTPATAYGPVDVARRWAGCWVPEAEPALVAAAERFVGGTDEPFAGRVAAVLEVVSTAPCAAPAVTRSPGSPSRSSSRTLTGPPPTGR